MLSLGAAFLGFFLTLLVWNRVTHWAYSIWKARAERGVVDNSPIAMLVLLFANSAPWLLGAYATFCYYIFGHAHREEWSCFWAGAAVVPPSIGMIVFLTLRRIKKAKVMNSVAKVGKHV